jgi:hypothetical protein
MTAAHYREIRAAELERLLAAHGGSATPLREAAELLDELVLAEKFTEFLTIPGYARLA